MDECEGQIVKKARGEGAGQKEEENKVGSEVSLRVCGFGKGRNEARRDRMGDIVES